MADFGIGETAAAVAATSAAEAGTAAAASAAATAAAASAAGGLSLGLEAGVGSAALASGSAAVASAAGVGAGAGGLFSALGSYGSLLSAGTTLLSAAAKVSSGNYQSDALGIQAQNAKNTAALQEQQTNVAIGDTIGRQRAIYGASGVDSDSGSPTDVYANTAAAGGVQKFNFANQAGITSAADLDNAAVAQQQGQVGAVGSIAQFLSSPTSPIANAISRQNTNQKSLF